MGIQRQPVQGFETELVELPDVPLSGADRERMMRVVAAIVTGATPEEITGYLAGGFPEAVDQLLGQPLESEEMSAHVDVLLAAAA